MTYKGHKIEKYESMLQVVYVIDGDESMLQVVYVIDGDEANAYWSLADAKRAINGQPIVFAPVNIENSPFFEKKD